MKLSIIIPIYNIREYIVQCIESCICQEYISQYEIILVNDGTKDDSIDLALPYVHKYNNISIVQRKNGGLSAARNSGLKVAKGKYIWFVDGDDYLENGAIPKVLKAIDTYQCDLFILGYNSIINGKKINTTTFALAHEIINGHEEFLKCNFKFPMLVWTHVYKTQFLRENSLVFYEGIIHEDLEFKFRSHYLATSIHEIHEPLYNYRLARENSIMFNMAKNAQRSINSHNDIISKFLEDCQQMQIPQYVKKQYLSDLSLLALEQIYTQNNAIIRANKVKIKRYIAYLITSNQIRRKVFAILCFLLPSSTIRFIIRHYHQNIKY